MFEQEEPFSFSELLLQPGGYVEIENVAFTLARYGPLRVVVVWEEGYLEPLFLVTNMLLGEEALACYRRRYGIETFFSDQKSRGFIWRTAISAIRSDCHGF